jgi:hypothetical protein
MAYWLLFAYCLLPIAYLPVPQSLHLFFRRLCLQKMFGLQTLHWVFRLPAPMLWQWPVPPSLHRLSMRPCYVLA